jgi:hypothetical protein
MLARTIDFEYASCCAVQMALDYLASLKEQGR